MSTWADGTKFGVGVPLGAVIVESAMVKVGKAVSDGANAVEAAIEGKKGRACWGTEKYRKIKALAKAKYSLCWDNGIGNVLLKRA